MTFENPLALLGFLLAIPIVILYLRRIRLRRQPVTMNMLWERVLAEEPIRSAWQRWRYPASLAVQLMVLALIVAALADVQFRRPRQVILILDNSTSTKAMGWHWLRSAEAMWAAQRLIEGLGPHDRMAILSASDPPSVDCRFTADRHELEKAVAWVCSIRGTGRFETVLDVAWRLKEAVPNGRVILISDGCLDTARLKEHPSNPEIIRVGKRRGNVCISRLAVRRSMVDPAQGQILVEVHNFYDHLIASELGVAIDKSPVATERIELEADGRWQRVISTTLPDAGEVTAQLDQHDVLPYDNEASCEVPPVTDAARGTPSDAQARIEWGEVLREADLRAPGDLAVEAGEITFGRSGRSLWLYLAGLALTLLVGEWCLYQRRWIE